MRVLGRKSKSEMLAAASVARVVIAVYGDEARGSFEPRALADTAELESAIQRHDFIGLLTFIGVPPQIWLAVQLDHKAKQSFNELVSRLTAAAVNDATFWAPRAPRLAQLSGARTIEAR